MKKAGLSVILILACFATTLSQWTQTDGPYGNSNVISVFKHNNRYFSSAYLCGFFSKPDVADRWQLNSGNYFKTYTLRGDSLFAELHYYAGGMDRNMGLAMIDLNHPENPPVVINSWLEANDLKNDGNFLYGADEYDGFYRVKFDGTQPAQCNNGLPTDTIWTPWGTYYETHATSIEIANNYFYCGTDQGMYRTPALTEPWVQINNGLPEAKVSFIELYNDTLFTAIENTLYYSPDNGNNWITLYNAAAPLTSLLKEGTLLFVGTETMGVFTSANNGLSWESMNEGLTDLKVNLITRLDSVLYCGVATRGLYKFNNGAWNDDNPGIISSLIRSLTMSNNTLFANDFYSAFSSNAGGGWSNITPNVNYELLGSVASMDNKVFLSVEYDTTGWPYDLPFILYSHNGGNTWNQLANPVPFAGDDPYRIHCNNGNLYAYENEKMAVTSNLGQTWTDLSLPAQFCNYFYGFTVYNNQPFAAACGNGQVVKLNNSNQWVLSNTGLPSDREPYNFASCNNALFVFIEVHGMYVSFDNGNNWSYANAGLNPEWGFRDYAAYGEHLFISTENGIFVTSNYGQNWVACNDGLMNLNCSGLQILNDTLYAGTYGNGIWKRAIQDVNLHVDPGQLAHEALSLYPNPAKDYFIIQTPNHEPCELSIYNMLGQQVTAQPLNPGEKTKVAHLQNGTYMVFIKSKTTLSKHKLIISR